MAERRFAIVPDTAILALGRSSNLAGVYMFFAMHADADGTNARPSVRGAAAFFGIQKRSVERCLEWLIHHGLMAETGPGPNRVMTYRMVRGAALQHDLDLFGELPPESGHLNSPSEAEQLPPESGHQWPHLAHSSGRSKAAQPDPLTRPSPDHTRIGRARDPSPPPNVESPRAAPDPDHDPDRNGGAGMQGPSSDPAPPTNGHVPAPAQDRRPGRVPPPQTEAQEQAGQAERLLEEGLCDGNPTGARLRILLALVRDYRTRWPKSWPVDWVLAADWPQLDGPVKDRAGWIYTQVHGYARLGWEPETRAGSERQWHAAMLAGDTVRAMELAGIENSYSPERLAAKLKLDQGPKRHRRKVEPDPPAEGPRESLAESGGVMRELAFDRPPHRAREAAAALDGLAQDQARRLRLAGEGPAAAQA